MSIKQKAKERKPKVSKAQTYSHRRQADRHQRATQRAGAGRKQQAQRQYRYRVKVVRMYRQLRQQTSEKRAAALTYARWQPTAAWHFPLSIRTIRHWHHLVTTGGWAALRPRSRRPQTIQYQIPEVVVGIIYTLRTLYGWGGHRLAAELARRGIWQLCGQTVYNLFDRLGLAVKPYALKGKSDGIAYRRYEAARPNAQWHIDLKQTNLSDGAVVYICVLLDGYSRYALAAVAGLHKTSQWVAQVAQQTIRQAGTPTQLVSDNGREFCSVWEQSLTKFGQLLDELGIDHCTTAPYYPQTNGKVEAFNKTLTRELLERRTFASLAELQLALDRFLTYYNNYRAHSALAWQPPITRYTGRHVAVVGLAALPGLEPMSARPEYQPAAADPPIPITPNTAAHAFALAPVPLSLSL